MVPLPKPSCEELRVKTKWNFEVPQTELRRVPVRARAQSSTLPQLAIPDRFLMDFGMALGSIVERFRHHFPKFGFQGEHLETLAAPGEKFKIGWPFFGHLGSK